MSTDDNSVTMFSFLAGVFLMRNRISCSELAILIEDFSNKMNCYICDNGNYFGLDDFFRFNKKELVLLCGYNNSVGVNGSLYVFEDYLYDLTNDIVREYFSIPTRKKKGIFKGKNKTKVSWYFSLFLLGNIFSYLFLLCGFSFD